MSFLLFIARRSSDPQILRPSDPQIAQTVPQTPQTIPQTPQITQSTQISARTLKAKSNAYLRYRYRFINPRLSVCWQMVKSLGIDKAIRKKMSIDTRIVAN